MSTSERSKPASRCARPLPTCTEHGARPGRVSAAAALTALLAISMAPLSAQNYEGGTACVVDGNNAHAWHWPTSSWRTQSVVSNTNLIRESSGNIGVMNSTGSTRFAYVFDATTGTWHSKSVPGATMMSGSGGNFAVLAGTGSSASVYTWNALTAQWSQAVNVPNASILVESDGSFAVYASSSASFMYAWSPIVGTWNATPNPISLPPFVVGSGGNFAVLGAQSSGSMVHAWDGGTGVWTAASAPNVNNLVGSLGRFAAISGNAAYVWSSTTAQWQAQSIPNATSIRGSGGNFCVLSAPSSSTTAYAYKGDTNTWSSRSTPNANQIETSQGNFGVHNRSSAGSAYAWDAGRNTWDALSPFYSIAAPSRMVGSGGNFAILDASGPSTEAHAWHASQGVWTTSMTPYTEDLTGAGGRFAAIRKSSTSGSASTWRPGASAWTTTPIADAYLIRGSGSNFAVVTNNGSASRSYFYTPLSPMWSINYPTPWANQVTGSEGNFAIYLSQSPNSVVHAWHAASNTLRNQSVPQVDLVIGSNGSFGAIASLFSSSSSQAHVVAWNGSTYQWQQTALPFSSGLDASGGTFVATNSTSGAAVFDRFLGAWAPSPPPLQGTNLYEASATPFWNRGFSLPGTNGITPELRACGTLRAGDPMRLQLSNARPSSPMLMVIGALQAGVPFFGGILLPTTDVVLSLGTDAQGNLIASFPTAGGLAHQVTHVHCWIYDPGAPQGMSASNALTFVYQ